MAEELERYLALNDDVEDEIGQASYHVAFAKDDKVYSHILDLDKSARGEDHDSKMRTLIKDGKLTDCEECFKNLKTAHKYLLEHGSSSCSDNSSITFSLASDSEQDNAWNSLSASL